jgi:hypothetical protein
MRPFQARKSTVQTAAAMELFQLADELSYISGVAAVTFAVTLVVSAPDLLNDTESSCCRSKD